MKHVLIGLMVWLSATLCAVAQESDTHDPRARVSIDPNSRTPDHLSHIVGPPPTLHVYEGKLIPQQIYRFDANPQAGFHWPYLLAIPAGVEAGSSILVEPNNDGLWGAPFETHEYWSAIRNEQLFVDFGRYLNTPMLTPIFPRPLVDGPDHNLYIHALTRPAMVHDDPSYARPDLQLLAMLDDAQQKLRNSGHVLTEDVLLWGFSAAADFVTRMTVLHPEGIRAVVAGVTLNANALRETPFLLFQGGADENDSVKEPPFSCEDYGSDSYSCEQALWVNNTFGTSTVDRVPKIAAIYRDFGMSDFNSIILPGVDHSTPDPMVERIRDFFTCVLDGNSGCATRTEVPNLSESTGL